MVTFYRERLTNTVSKYNYSMLETSAKGKERRGEGEGEWLHLKHGDWGSFVRQWCLKDLKEKEINQKGSEGQVFLPVGTVKAEPEA